MSKMHISEYNWYPSQQQAIKIPWLTPETENKNEDQEIELKPKDVKDKLDKIDGMETEVKKISKLEEGQTEILGYFRQAKADREAARQRAEEAEQVKRQKAEDDNAPSFEDDPVAAVNRQLDPILKQNYLLSAKQNIRDMVESNQLEFYTGDIKSEVDKLIEAQAMRGNPVSTEYIENAYYIAKGKKEKDIADGKIKSRFSAASGASSGTGGLESNPDKSKQALSEDEKRYAAALGIKDEDYNKFREAEYV